MRDARARELAGNGGALAGRGLGEAVAQLCVVRVDLELVAALRVDEPERPGGLEHLLARVAHLDRDDLVASCEPQEGRRQSRGPRKSETTTTSARWRAAPAARPSACASGIPAVPSGS